MADLYYYEEGYIDAKYHAYVAVAEGLIAPYFENGYLEEYYFLNEGSWATMTFEGDIVNVIVEASGSFVSEFAQITATGIIKSADSALASTVTQSTDIDRFRLADSAITATVTQTALAGKIQQAAAAFTDAFTPTLIADAFKNHTAILETAVTMNTAAVVDRSANVLLEHIADLNAMAAKVVDPTATFSTNFSQSTQGNKTQQYQAEISSSSALSCNGGKLKLTSATVNPYFGLLASKYLGTGRPRDLYDIDYQYLNEYFTTPGKFGSYALKATAPTTSIIAKAAAAYTAIPSANEDWVFECWYYNGSHSTHSLFQFLVGGGQRFVNLTANDTRTFTLRLFKEGGVSTNSTSTTSESSNTWLHIALVYSLGYAALFVNGQRRLLQDLSAYTNSNYTGRTIEVQDLVLRLGVQGSAALDEASLHHGTTLGFNPQSTTITVPSTARTNDPVYTQFLYHFENNGYDDVTVAHLVSSSLSTAASLSAQANPNTKSVAATFTSTSVISVSAERIRSSQSSLSTSVNLDINAGKLKGISDTIASEFNLVDGLQRIRYAESTQNALFSPSITVRATKIGEIVLQSQFTVTVDANSFTDCPATLASQFVIAADVDGVTRITAVALSSAFIITDNLGKLVTAQSNITGAFNAQITAQYFEGTSLLAPMTASMSVTARKTARITKTLAVTASISATGFEAPADPGPVATLKPYGLWHFDTFTPIYGLPPNDNIIQGYQTYDSYDAARYMWATQNTAQSKFGGSSLDSPTSITAGVVAGTIDSPTIGSGDFTADLWYYWVDPTGTPAGFGRAIGVPNSNGSAVLYEIRTYAMNGGALLINGSTVFTFSLSGWQHLALQRNGTALTLWRDGALLTTQTVSQDAVGTRWAVDTVRSGNTAYSSRGFIDELRIRNIAGYTTTFTPPTSAYDLEYDIVDIKQLYAILEPRFTIDAQGISVVFIQSQIFAGTFTQTAQSARTRSGASALTTASTVYANAGLRAVTTANLSATATVSATVDRLRSATATLTAQTTVSASATRVRFAQSSLIAAATASADAVKRTGNIISAQSTVTQTTVGERIRFGESAFSAFNSTVTVAAKNATGTVTLESTASLSAQPVKDAQGIVALTAQAEITANTAGGKIVGFGAALTSESSVFCDGERIQPAGSDMISEFALTTTTTDSKITRVSAGLNTVSTINATVERFRAGISLEVSAATLICQNSTIRFGTAALVSEIYDFTCSPTFIVRITADFTAFNAIVTVGEVINIDPYLTLWIKPESRTTEIPSETRVLPVLQETRVNIIEGYSQ